MHLQEQWGDGRRFVATPNDIHSYGKALAEAEAHFRRSPDAVALYLWSDGNEKVVRTYYRHEAVPPYRYARVLEGYHPWPKPPTMYPGVLPEDMEAPDRFAFGLGDPVVRLTERAYEHELNEADRKGYNRGFKVGLSHRNRERAAQLRRQADSLERTAGWLTPTGRMSFKGLDGGGGAGPAVPVVSYQRWNAEDFANRLLAASAGDYSDGDDRHRP